MNRVIFSGLKKIASASLLLSTLSVQAGPVIVIPTTNDTSVYFWENQYEKTVVFDDVASTRFTTLYVPSGALASSEKLWYTPFSDTHHGLGHPDAPTGYAGITFDFHFDDLSLHLWDEPVTLTVKYTNGDVAGLDENSLTLLYFDYDYVEETGEWVPALDPYCGKGVVSRDLVNNTISMDICHFTQYALAGSE